MMAKDSYRVLIGGYLNIGAIADYICREDKDVVILCAGWKNKFNIEDTLFAGALSDMLLKTGKYSTICDSTYASKDLWELAKNDLMGYIEKAAQRHRLKKNQLDDILEYCHTFNITDNIPALNDYYLKELKT
jgi:2-phosphosulfolactate phosphatase